MDNKDYELINLEVEYPGIQGGCRWAVATDLSYDELFAQYGSELEAYKPLLLISKAQAEVFKEYHRNDSKHERREYRCHDPRGYLEGLEKEQAVLNYLSSRLEIDDVLNAVYLKVAMQKLTEKQRERLKMYFYDCLTEEEIADKDGVTQPAIHKSIQAAISDLRFMLDI